MSCCICLEDLSSPVSLPCGHIFCHECLKRAVQAIQPYSTLHACPTCRSHYFITPLDMSTIPLHLRPHVTPSIRKVYLDLPPKGADSNSKASTVNAATPDSSRTLSLEVARLRAEVEALRYNCSMWRRRAEVHSSATIGLLELSRTARDQIIQTCRERDAIQRNYLKLNHDFQRQQAILQALVSTTMPPHHFGPPSNLSQPQPFIDQPVSDSKLSAITAQRGSCPAEESRRKRLRQEDDGQDSTSPGSAYLHSRPAKIPRRVVTDDTVTRPTIYQTERERS